jgi:hypothetical protein
LNDLNFRRLQSDLNVALECFWIMTGTHLHQIKRKACVTKIQ